MEPAGLVLNVPHGLQPPHRVADDGGAARHPYVVVPGTGLGRKGEKEGEEEQAQPASWQGMEHGCWSVRGWGKVGWVGGWDVVEASHF